MYLVVYGRGEDLFVRTLGVSAGWRDSAVVGTFDLETTKVCNLFDHHHCGHPRAAPGYYGAAAKLGQFGVNGVC